MASPPAGQEAAGPAIVESAWAKINLGLRVLRRRPDGYHDLVTCMQTVDLRDRLFLAPAPEARFTCTDSALSTGPDNLVRRALALFADEVAALPPLRVHLVKRIPMGAGLGGGSADAAAALRAANRLSGAPCGWERLRSLGARLGSDVPFLVAGGTALARGRGEILEPLRWQGSFSYVLASPPVHVETRWAYAALDAHLTERDESPSLTTFVLSGGRVDHELLLAAFVSNDFEIVVQRAYPIVADLLSQFVQCGARAATMTGSGSTVVGVFDDRNAADATCEALQAAGIRSFLCHAVDPFGVSGSLPAALPAG